MQVETLVVWAYRNLLGETKCPLPTHGHFNNEYANNMQWLRKEPAE